MKAATAGRLHYVSLILIVGALLGASLPLAAVAADTPEPMASDACGNPSTDSNRLHRMLTSLVDWLLPYSSGAPTAGVNCLTAEDEPTPEGQRKSVRFEVPSDRSGSRVPLNMNYTLSGLVQHDEYPSTVRPESGLQLRIGENISLLARHLDLTQELMRTAMEMSGVTSPSSSFDERVPQELALQLGNTTLAAKADFMTGLTQYLTRSLTNADVPLPEAGDDVTLVFNMSGGGVSGLDISTVLQQTQQASGLSNPLNIGEITVRISNGNVTSEAELDPAEESIQIKRGKFAVNYHFGSNTLTSTTTFSRGEGVEEQRFQLTAQLGSVDFTGQALLFNNSGLQEFKLEAFWEGLTFSTLLTPQGFQESSIGLDLEF